jgi:glutathione synthase/RimK-type ligase-like ATP-grasp enzyme
MIYLYPYKVGSRSVRALKHAVNGTIIKLENSRYRYRQGHTIINWGNPRIQPWMQGVAGATILNHPTDVAVASNKLRTFQVLQAEAVPTVPWTEDQTDAQDWLDQGRKVYSRAVLNGHSGEGITVHHPNNEARQLTTIAELFQRHGDVRLGELLTSINPPLPQAPLYTMGINNHGEYRVHVFAGEVILYQKKSRRVDEDGNVVTPEGEEADVRNLASNWVYRTGNLRRTERIESLALDAVQALNLDFGAVDIIKDENGDVFVLEVNTAPGLGNTETLEAYTNAINQLNN